MNFFVFFLVSKFLCNIKVWNISMSDLVATSQIGLWTLTVSLHIYMCALVDYLYFLNKEKHSFRTKEKCSIEIFFLHKQVSFKGCVCYLNRCSTSPTYILYQINEKNELTITYHIFFDLRHCHFLIRRLPATAYFPQTKLCLWNLQQENQGKPVFISCDVLECPNESCFKNQNNYLGEIDDQIKELDWLQVSC